MEAYVDDILVKTIEIADHVKDLGEAFNALRCHQMKLNMAKYVFKVTSAKLPGFVVTN